MQNSSYLIDEDFARALHIGEVAFSYYQVQRSTPTEQDYNTWLSMLPQLLNSRYTSIGFEEGKDLLDFRRYFVEIRLQEMKTYMQRNLSPEDFTLWLEMRDKPASL